MTSNDFAVRLEQAGVQLSPDRVRQLWRRGYSRTSPRLFAKRYAREIRDGSRSDPELKQARRGLVEEQTRLAAVRREREATNLEEHRRNLVSRGWVVERVQKMGGELNAIRAKSENEDAPRFAAAGGDIAKARTILRGVWDRIHATLVSLGHHLEE